MLGVTSEVHHLLGASAFIALVLARSVTARAHTPVKCVTRAGATEVLNFWSTVAPRG